MLVFQLVTLIGGGAAVEKLFQHFIPYSIRRGQESQLQDGRKLLARPLSLYCAVDRFMRDSELRSQRANAPGILSKVLHEAFYLCQVDLHRRSVFVENKYVQLY